MLATRSRHRRIALVMLGALVAIIGSSVALAQERKLGGKVRTGDEVVVPADETVAGDLYATGGQVRIDGVVEGDLIAAGGQIQVPGEVGGDLLAASGNVDISGQVGGDARIGSGQVTVSGAVGEDLFVGSGQVTISSSGVVGEDFIFGTGQTTLDGRVEGSVLGSTGSYTRRGTIGGTEEVNIARREEPTLGDRLLDALQRFIAILVVGGLLLWLLPRVIDGTADTLRRRPWASLGVGVLTFVGFFVLIVGIVFIAILLAIGLGLIRLEDLVGITIWGTGTLITALGFLFFVAAAFAVQAAVGRVLGGLGTAQRWTALVIGVLVVVVISSLPVVGGWFGFLIALFGLGALTLEFWPWRRRAPQPA